MLGELNLKRSEQARMQGGGSTVVRADHTSGDRQIWALYLAHPSPPSLSTPGANCRISS